MKASAACVMLCSVTRRSRDSRMFDVSSDRTTSQRMPTRAACAWKLTPSATISKLQTHRQTRQTNKDQEDENHTTHRIRGRKQYTARKKRVKHRQREKTNLRQQILIIITKTNDATTHSQYTADSSACRSCPRAGDSRGSSRNPNAASHSAAKCGRS